MTSLPLRRIFGQPSYILETSSVQLALTRLGGHMGPVTFFRNTQPLQPYHVAPWWDEPLSREIPVVLKVLRGDFFCMPFGANQRVWRGGRHPLHGEVANRIWNLKTCTRTRAGIRGSWRLDLRISPGRVTKSIALLEGEQIIYQEHKVEGISGAMPVAYHPMLRFPSEEGSGTIALSPFALGVVNPEPTEIPPDGNSILKPGAEFTRLDDVPMVTGKRADLSHYPARRGYEDFVMLFSHPSVEVGWVAVSFPKQRYVWFSLRDARVLTATLFWISNGGRRYPPWNGRHIHVMGIEDGNAYFAKGLAESVQANPLSKRGFQTSVRLKASRSCSFRHIQGVARLPCGFQTVQRLETGDHIVAFIDKKGQSFSIPVQAAFINKGTLPDL